MAQNKAELLKKKFKQTDANGDGKLDFDEMCNLLRQGNPNLGKAELMKLFNKVDNDGSGFIDFNEFVDYLYSGSKPAAPAANAGEGEGPWDEVEAVLKIYDTQSNGLEGNEFSKILKDCKIFTRKFPVTECDLVFSKVCPKGSRKIDIEGFKAAIRIIATKKGVPTIEVQQVIGARASEGRNVQGTKGEYNRFHDDKTTFTGSHTTNAAHGDKLGGESQADRAGKRQSAGEAALDALGPEGDWTACDQVWKEYGGAEGFESKDFFKLLEDTGLLKVSANFRKNDVDIIFTAVVTKGQRKLTVEQYRMALKKVGIKTEMTIANIQETIGARAGVGKTKQGVTETGDVRFYNEKDMQVEQGAQRHVRLEEEKAKQLEQVGEEEDWTDCQTVFREYDDDKQDGFDSKEFAKLLKDCTILVGRKFTTIDADLIFTQVCPKGKRKLTFEEFKKSLKLIAVKKGCTIADLQGLVAQRLGLGKEIKATEAQYNRFHDDKSTYTGAHTGNAAHGENLGGESEADRAAKRQAEDAAAMAGIGEEGSWDDVQAAYKNYDKDDNGMDSKEYMKILWDADFIDKKFKVPDADMIFTKVCPRGQRKIKFEQFKDALKRIAMKKGVSIKEVQDVVGERGKEGPVLSGTVGEYNRFHDDKSTYTGAHTKNATHGENLGGESEGDRAAKRKAADEAALAAIGEEAPWDSVEACFQAYDGDGNGVDSKEFLKILTDSEIFDSSFNNADADIVFTKVCPSGLRKLKLDDFKQGLRRIAAKKECQIAKIQEAVGQRGVEGKKLSGTVGEYNKFHDDKTTYTGAHKDT